MLCVISVSPHCPSVRSTRTWATSEQAAEPGADDHDAVYRDRGPWRRSPGFTRSRAWARAHVGRVVAWLLWLAVHLVALTGFKNRIAVLFNLTMAFAPWASKTRDHDAAGRSLARSAEAQAAASTAVRQPFARRHRVQARRRAAALSTRIATMRPVSHWMKACRASPTIP